MGDDIRVIKASEISLDILLSEDGENRRLKM